MDRKENEDLKSLNNENQKIVKIEQPFRDTLVISFSFMAIYTAYLAIQNLQSSLNQEAGLGVTSLSFLYGTIILSGTFAPLFIQLVGAKWSLVLAWIIHTLYTASNFYPTWGTLIPTSILLGGIAGPMWTSQGLYITANGIAYSRALNENLHAVLSRWNGIFFTCYEATQITGNIISSLVLTRGSYNQTDDNSFKICGADDCPVAANSTKIVEPEKHIVYILLGIFLLCDIVGLFLTCFLLPPLSRDQIGPAKSIMKSVVSCCSTLADPKMMMLVPFFFATAMCQGLLLTEYTKAFVSCSIGIYMVGFVMASYGGITAIIALVMGRAAKYTGRYVLYVVAFVVNLAMLLTMLLWKPLNEHTAIFFIVPPVWGISEGIIRPQFNSLVAVLFSEETDSAFANYHTWNAIGFTVTFALGTFVCLRTRLYIAIGLLVLGFAGYVTAELLFSRAKKKQKLENIKQEYLSVNTSN